MSDQHKKWVSGVGGREKGGLWGRERKELCQGNGVHGSKERGECFTVKESCREVGVGRLSKCNLLILHLLGLDKNTAAPWDDEDGEEDVPPQPLIRRLWGKDGSNSTNQSVKDV